MARNITPNYIYENSGGATLANGNNAVAVAHGLARAPDFVTLLSSNNETGWLSCSVNATSLNITSAYNVTANRNIYWRATIGAGN